jgi:hypothetical protein
MAGELTAAAPAETASLAVPGAAARAAQAQKTLTGSS